MSKCGVKIKMKSTQGAKFLHNLEDMLFLFFGFSTFYFYLHHLLITSTYYCCFQFEMWTYRRICCEYRGPILE